MDEGEARREGISDSIHTFIPFMGSRYRIHWVSTILGSLHMVSANTSRYQRNICIHQHKRGPSLLYNRLQRDGRLGSDIHPYSILVIENTQKSS